MRNTKIYIILSFFNKIEQNRLRKYLVSPYFNANETLVELFELFLEDINQPNDAEFEKESIWHRLLPGTAFDDVRFRKYCSDLLKLIEGFLSQEVLEENPILKSNLLLDAVKKRKIEKLYSSSMRAARTYVQKNPFEDAESYFFRYQIEKKDYEISESELKRVSRSNIESISRNLDYFFIGEKLKYYLAALTQQQYVKLDYEIEFLDQILDYIAQNRDSMPPLVAIYYQIYLTTSEGNNLNHYQKLKGLLSQNSNSFQKNEAITLYYSAINYCIWRINSGDTSFNRELFNLYKEMVDRKIIFSDQDEMSPWDFKNIVQSAMRANELAWTEEFILEYGQKIPEQYRRNAVTFNLGQLYFYQKKYEDVLDQLRNVEYDDITYSLNSKAFLTWAYLELDEIELLMFHIESFRTFINRHKDIHGDRKKRYLLLLKFAKKLSKIFPGDAKAISKIKQELEQASKEGVVGINWIKEKIQELER